MDKILDEGKIKRALWEQHQNGFPGKKDKRRVNKILRKTLKEELEKELEEWEIEREV